PDIDGESTTQRHKDWIIIESMAWGGRNSDGRAEAQELSLTFKVSKATPSLIKALVNGTILASGTLEVTRTVGSSGEETYLRYELKNVQVTSYSLSGAGSSDRPMESISLNFERIEITYFEYNQAGELVGGYSTAWDTGPAPKCNA